MRCLISAGRRWNSGLWAVADGSGAAKAAAAGQGGSWWHRADGFPSPGVVAQEDPVAEAPQRVSDGTHVKTRSEREEDVRAKRLLDKGFLGWGAFFRSGSV